MLLFAVFGNATQLTDGASEQSQQSLMRSHGQEATSVLDRASGAENEDDGLASFLESVDKTKALLYVDLPEDCKTFATHCGASNEVAESLSSWDDASAAFESCCLAGGHETSTCSSIASESFGQRTQAFALDENVCKEMVDLYGSHIQNQLSRKASLSENNHAPEIAARIVNRAWVLKDTAPKFVAALLGGIAVGASLTQVSLGAVVLAQVAVQIAQMLDWTGGLRGRPSRVVVELTAWSCSQFSIFVCLQL